MWQNNCCLIKYTLVLVMTHTFNSIMHSRMNKNAEHFFIQNIFVIIMPMLILELIFVTKSVQLYLEFFKFNHTISVLDYSITFLEIM